MIILSKPYFHIPLMLRCWIGLKHALIHWACCWRRGIVAFEIFAAKSQSVGMLAILAILMCRTSPYPPSALPLGISTILIFFRSYTTSPCRCCSNADFSTFACNGISLFLCLENCQQKASTVFNLCNKSSSSISYLCPGFFLCTTSKVPTTTLVVFRAIASSNH